MRKIETLAIGYTACTSDKSCGKCYQVEGDYCHYYDCKTNLGMRCGLYLSKTSSARKIEAVRASESENGQTTQGSLF